MNWLIEHPLILCLTIALVAFLESFALLGLLVPGVVFLFSLSAIANTQGISPFAIMAAGMVGAAIGDISSYYIGRKLQHRVEHLKWFTTHQNWLEQGEWFIKRWGWLSVIIGRFLGPLRPVIPMVAGTLRMPPRVFIPLSLLTVLVWAPVYLLPGYYTGELAELWQLQPLSNQALIKYVLTTLAIAGSSIAIYHHAHPEQEHIRNWLSKNNALHWPVSSAGLTSLSLIAIALFLFFQPHTHNAEFLSWSLDWQQQRSTPVWLFFSGLGITEIVLAQLALLAVWLVLQRNWQIALIMTTALCVLAMLAQLLQSHLATSHELHAFKDMSLFTFFAGILAMLASNHLHGLKRWPIFMLTSVFIILSAVSHLWLGQLSLTATGVAISLALMLNGLVRSFWRTLGSSDELSYNYSGAMIILLINTNIAAALLGLA